MNILMVYPKYPNTFWSFNHALKFVSKKAAYPPLGLITVAAMLPKAWNIKLIDLNVESLKPKQIKWADYVFISAMSVHVDSVVETVKQCKSYNAILVGGGPLFTEEHERFPEFDHFVLNEAELTLDQFIHDLNAGIPKRVYRSDDFPQLYNTPIPDYSLLNLSKYASLSLQYTRGCPFDCEFCDITALFGHKVRTKTADQMIAEFDSLLKLGWQGSLMVVDDNFIGNKNLLKKDLLPALIQWMQSNSYPFNLTTEASINLADDPELMTMMVKAGFRSVFVGIETPVESSLAECNKVQNKNRIMLDSISAIQKSGIEVMAGFIVGFDNDPPSVFQQQIEFIQNSGIISAMVGLLNAPKKTKLYRRLEQEGRILSSFDGDNTNFSLNFIPKMNKADLLAGYKNLLSGIYNSKPFYHRVVKYLKKVQPVAEQKNNIKLWSLKALFRSMLWLGLLDKSRRYYWRLFFWTLLNKPSQFSKAITYSIYGYHFRKVYEKMW